MKAPTVKELRENGNRVYVRHQRHFELNNPLFPRTISKEAMTVRKAKELGLYDKHNIFPRGGLTEVEIHTPDGDVLSGKAPCSEADNYNKKIGRAIAIGRALTSK